MTQTSTPVATVAFIPVPTSHTHGIAKLFIVPMTSVDLAREEFGPTLADAQAFVEGVCCNWCGVSAEEARMDGHECHGCGIQACACLVLQDLHGGDVWFCTGCQQVCGCRDCTDD